MGFHLEAPVQLIKVGSLVLLPAIEAGKVFLPELAPWVHDYYLDELAAFPNGVHDDAFDSTTQSLNYLRHQQVHTVAIFNALTGRCLSD